MEHTTKDNNNKSGLSNLTPHILTQNTIVEKQTNKSLIQQYNILKKLEKGLPHFDGKTFKDQVHFQSAPQTPIQRWFSYREGYSVKLVDAFIKSFNIKGPVFDPFCGSGTTLLSARLNNLKSYGIDVNPISTLATNVSNENYSPEDVKHIYPFINNLSKMNKPNTNYSTLFSLADKVFNQEILQALLYLKSYILDIDNEKLRNLFFFAWLSIIEEVSNVKKEGNGIKYRNRKRTSSGYINIEKEDWERKYFPENKFEFVRNKLISRLNIMLADIEHHYNNNAIRPTIHCGCCLNFDELFSDKIQLTFYSPPYCNCFDYFEIHKVELWLGEFVKTKDEFRNLRNTGFRSNTNSINGKPIHYNNEHINNLTDLFDMKSLWNKKIPEVVKGYFDDTSTLLKKVHSQTTKNGYVGIVVGNSAYSGVVIPTDLLIANIAKEAGFTVEGIYITRHLTTSSQQKLKLEHLKNYLRESIVLLKK